MTQQQQRQQQPRRPHPSPFDPFPEASANEDPTSPAIVCLYGDGQLEAHRLEILRHEVAEAHLKVWYPGAYHRPSRRGTFRVPVGGRVVATTFTFQSNAASVRLYRCIGEERDESSKGRRGEALYQYSGGGSDASHTVDLPAVTENDATSSVHYVVVELETTEEEGPPCLAIQDDTIRSDGIFPGGEMVSSMCSDEWQWRGGQDEAWTPCQSFVAAAKSFDYPHRVPQKTNMMELSPKRYDDENDVWDFGVELYGWICFSIADEDNKNDTDDAPLALFVGESLEECLDDDVSCQEQSTELIRERPQDEDDAYQRAVWRTKHLVAFRYARVHGTPSSPLDSSSVHCRAVYRPVTYLGSFRCPEDSALERIWHHSAYTLRLSLQEGFVLDGVKRDRLPWMGDLLVALLANAYSFADRDVIAWTLTVLGRAGIATEHVNGFLDYTLLWIISQDLYQLYFDDRPFLRREWPRIKAVVGTLIARSCDDTGFLLIDKERDRIFLDWIDEDTERYTAAQIMWWRALGAAATLASRMDDADAKEAWASHQGRLRDSLSSQCQDNTSNGLWLESPHFLGKYSRHATMLAAVWKLNDYLSPQDSAVAVDRLLGPDLAPAGTPYMKILECLAIANLGRSEEAVERMHAYWGGMLDQNATTFWESFVHDNKDAYSMYGRSWAKSLCHAWASGPLFFLPQVKLGIVPLKDGWTEWAFNPSIQTKKIEQTVPTPNGLIEVMVNCDTFRVTIPAGTVMHHGGKRYEGPQTVEGRLFTSRMAEISDSFRGWTYYPTHVIDSSPDGIDVQMTDVPTVYRIPGCDDAWFMSFVGFDGDGYQSYVAESRNLVDWTNIRLAFGYGATEDDWDYGGRVLGAYVSVLDYVCLSCTLV